MRPPARCTPPATFLANSHPFSVLFFQPNPFSWLSLARGKNICCIGRRTTRPRASVKARRSFWSSAIAGSLFRPPLRAWPPPGSRPAKLSGRAHCGVLKGRVDCHYRAPPPVTESVGRAAYPCRRGSRRKDAIWRTRASSAFSSCQ
jgi:hypothetical protein